MRAAQQQKPNLQRRGSDEASRNGHRATQFVAQMKQGATALQAAMLQRNEERAALTPEALANARLKTDEALKELLFVADAVITMFGEETLPRAGGEGERTGALHEAAHGEPAEARRRRQESCTCA